MHLKRQAATTKLPITRKGTKYVVRASSHNSNSVPTLIAVRDILKLAQTAREVKSMIQRKLLKVNGKEIKDIKQSIKLFDILEADKVYRLIILPTKRFSFEEAKHKSERICKVMGRTLVKDGKIQLNLHDGTNVITSHKVKVGDSVKLDFSNKIKDHVSFEKGKSCSVIGGRYAGREGKIVEVDNRHVKIKLNEKEEPVIPAQMVIAL